MTKRLDKLANAGNFRSLFPNARWGTSLTCPVFSGRLDWIGRGSSVLASTSETCSTNRDHLSRWGIETGLFVQRAGGSQSGESFKCLLR